MMDVEQILEKHKLTGPYPQDEYVRYMEQKFKNDGDRFLYFVDECLEMGFTPERWRRIYNLKNKNKNMSLYISSHSYTAIFKEALRWLSVNIDGPDSFIELGSENGMLTFCVSDLWKTSEARGVDSVGVSVSTARKLAFQFGKSHIKFFVADLAQKGSCKSITQSEILLAPFLFHELLYCSVEEWENITENIKGMMPDSGSLVTFNRFPNPKIEVQQLNSKLSRINLFPNRSDELKVGEETFPVIVYNQK
jgi:hypothetical protein